MRKEIQCIVTAFLLKQVGTKLFHRISKNIRSGHTRLQPTPAWIAFSFITHRARNWKQSMLGLENQACESRRTVTEQASGKSVNASIAISQVLWGAAPALMLGTTLIDSLMSFPGYLQLRPDRKKWEAAHNLFPVVCSIPSELGKLCMYIQHTTSVHTTTLMPGKEAISFSKPMCIGTPCTLTKPRHQL